MHDRADIGSSAFPQVCKLIAERFDLRPVSELVVGLDQMYWDFTIGGSTVELAWDNWLCFTVTAKAPDAEPLVRRIASFLSEASLPESGS
ncbi:MAG: hypothetical protein QM775_29090 [Pirellulales bacterium]